jgi:hypothetical protein
VADLVLDTATMSVTRAGTPIKLTPKSATAIAAAFSMMVAELKSPDYADRNERQGFNLVDWLPRARTAVRLTAGTVAAFLIVFGGFYYQAVSAEPLTVDFGVLRNGDDPRDNDLRLLSDSG